MSSWAPTPQEAEWLAECSAIVYFHDGQRDVVRLDALPQELAAYVRQTERAEAAKAKRDAQRLLKRRLR